MRELIAQIKEAADRLYTYGPGTDSVVIDSLLGELDCLVHKARLEIDVEWRRLREIHFAAKAIADEIKPSTLEDLI